jgi:hypothetical protein
MKKINILSIIAAGMLVLTSCGEEFLQKLPQGQLSQPQVANKDGVEAELLGAYGILNGNINGTWGNYASAPSQWLFGEVASDNAHKGSEQSDQPDMNMIETYTTNSANDNFSAMWQVYYEGVLRANSTLVLLKGDQEGAKQITAARATEIQAEARTLRAHYYFYLWRIFKNIPYIDENTTLDEAKVKPNNEDILPKIIDDLKFAIDNLPTSKINGQSGRMNKDIAKAYLGKVYLYQKKWAEALPLFTEVLAGKDITTMPFQNNFDPTKEDGPESLLVSKHAINSNGAGDNANVGDMLSGLYGSSPVGCCGFYQPTIDLVNAYRVGSDGLPLFNNGYRANPYLSDLGLTGAAKTNYELDVTLSFDPRLDYTVGRRGVQYLDYGVMPGDPWIRDADYAGPFVGMKTMIPQSQFAAHAAPGTNYVTDLDVNIIRLADVVLMAAECNIELGNLPAALGLINDIRIRAAMLPPKKAADGSDAANYSVMPYPSFPNQAYARQALQYERRLELAMEGHRFFDLVRWGIAKQTLESYSSFEGNLLPAYKNLVFNSNNEFWQIPQGEIDRSNGTLTQN